MLSNNNLTRFEEDVYKSVLQQLAPYCGSPVCTALVVMTNGRLYLIPNCTLKFIMFITSYIQSSYTDPIDCESDPCHLAWLIKDNRYLLNPIADGVCSNGTKFTDVDSNYFTFCPVTPVRIHSVVIFYLILTKINLFFRNRQPVQLTRLIAWRQFVLMVSYLLLLYHKFWY